MTRDEWLAERRTGLGASDVPAALGFSPFRSPLEVWCEKTGAPLKADGQTNDVMQWGLDVEAGIARAYERQTGRSLVREAYRLVHHPDYPELFATPDAQTIERQPRLVQFKWSRRAEGWGDPGTDDIPEAYLVQCASEMACFGCELEDLAAMVVGPPVLIYPLHRNRELEQEIVEAARDWWHSYVVKRVEPPLAGDPTWARYLGRKFPVNKGDWLEAGDRGDPLRDEVECYLEARAIAEKAKDAEEFWKNRLKLKIEDRDGVRWKGGEITWKREQDHKEDITDWASLFTVLCGEFKVPVERQKQVRDVYTQFGIVTRKGSQKFIVREDERGRNGHS